MMGTYAGVIVHKLPGMTSDSYICSESHVFDKGWVYMVLVT